MTRVFGWLLLPGRGHASKDAEIDKPIVQPQFPLIFDLGSDCPHPSGDGASWS